MTHILGPIMVGKALPFRNEETSAIFKSPTEGPVQVGPLGLAGDEQADLTVHGGVDKAIHHYPRDHYATWQKELEGHPLLSAPGAFGENLTTTGLLENEVCIGDRFRLGTAQVEVSQGRQPCWKIDHKFQTKGVTARVIATTRCGWYYRVIEEGVVEAGDRLELTDRPHPAWTVARAFALLVAGGHKSERRAVEELGKIPQLAESWKIRAAKLSEVG